MAIALTAARMMSHQRTLLQANVRFLFQPSNSLLFYGSVLIYCSDSAGECGKQHSQYEANGKSLSNCILS